MDTTRNSSGNYYLLHGILQLLSYCWLVVFLAQPYLRIRVNNSLPLVSDHIIILRILLIVNSLIGLAESFPFIQILVTR
jgi:hypothetical protein